MDLFKRVVREFWAPALVAAAWTIYNVATKDSGWTLSSAVNVFGPSFFLISWATGQVFRIKKQTSVEKNLRSIEGRLESVVLRLEERANDLVGHITGGESFCYVQLGVIPDRPSTFQVVVVHKGDHPLYDISARIADLECYAALTKAGQPIDMRKCDKTFGVETLTPGHAAFVHPVQLAVSSVGIRANIFFSARNGDFTQILRMARKDDRWRTAHAVKREATLLMREIDDGFPAELLEDDSDWKNVAQQVVQADVPRSARAAA